MDIDFKAVQPEEAIKYFRQKGYKTSFDWREVWQEEHATAFTVAKATRLDILQDIRGAMDNAIADGTTFETFQSQLTPTLQKKGWWGIKEMEDPKTGELRDVQLGSARRLRTIYDTNLRSAYSAGAWERIQRTKQTRPFLRYVVVDDNRLREKHRGWQGTILPIDHPFWETFYPPNGWHCRCSVQQLSQRDLDRRGLKVTEIAPSPPLITHQNKKTGRIDITPRGIDPGFGFNIGKARMRALTPPPVNKPLNVPYMGDPAKVLMPPPRKVPQSVLLDSDLSEEEYITAFLKEFDAKPSKPVIFKDVTGEEIIISADLFKTAGGRTKLNRKGDYNRAQHILLLAQSIKDPDEIWWVWEEYPKGRMTLRRKYIASYDIEGVSTSAFSVFDTGRDGWNGITTFIPDKKGYTDRQRNGALIYQKKTK